MNLGHHANITNEVLEGSKGLGLSLHGDKVWEAGSIYNFLSKVTIMIGIYFGEHGIRKNAQIHHIRNYSKEADVDQSWNDGLINRGRIYM